MYLIAALGLLMTLLSLAMVVKPGSFSDEIISFSKKPYFHLFEIISRVISGIIFVVYAADTLAPKTMYVIGVALIVVGLGLAVTPPSAHKKFAIWSANNFRSKFRLIGLVSIPLALLLIYSAVGNTIKL